MDTTDAFLKVVHAFEYCERETARYPGFRFMWYMAGRHELKRLMQAEWGVRLEMAWAGSWPTGDLGLTKSKEPVTCGGEVKCVDGLPHEWNGKPVWIGRTCSAACSKCGVSWLEAEQPMGGP
jgi:hypothetical protein